MKRGPDELVISDARDRQGFLDDAREESALVSDQLLPLTVRHAPLLVLAMVYILVLNG